MSHRTLWRTLSVAGLALAALTGCDNPAQDVEESVDEVQQGVEDAEQRIREGAEDAEQDVQDGDDEEGGADAGQDDDG